ncbi:MAG: TolA-binding protein [Limisphaerales bacterium]|jgi:TolA-binding protein
MIRIGIILCLFSFCITACSESQSSAKAKIQELELVFDKADNGAELPTEKTIIASNALIEAYQAYAQTWSGDTSSARMLYKAALKQELLGKSKEAVINYDKIWNEYPTHGLAPLCYYRTGYIYEKVFRDFNTARQRYTAFANSYPNHPLATKMELQLEYLGRDNDLLEAIIGQEPEE